MARSNAVMFDIVEIPPLEGIGWEVQVISHKDFYRQTYDRAPLAPAGKPVPLTVISRYVELTFSIGISDVGAGSIVLDMDDAMWNNPLTDGNPASFLKDREHLWLIYENGALRGAFLGQVVEEEILPAEDGQMRVVRISGPGPADVLRWAVIFNMYYPALPPIIDINNPTAFDFSKPSTWRFLKGPMLGIFLLLLNHAKQRNTLNFLDCDFTDALDSDGSPWVDMPAPEKDPETVTTTLTADVNFFPDSYVLAPGAAGVVAGWCVQFQALAAPHVTIVGHTDSTGSHAYNQTLSERRAQSVADLIREKVPHAVLSVSGKGETQPIAPNNTVAGREKNRRVTVTYPLAPDPTFYFVDYYKAQEGMNYLEVINELTGHDLDRYSPIRYEWLMRIPFHLEVRKKFGNRREKDVIFFEGSTNMGFKSRERRRADIVNSVLIHGTNAYTQAQSTHSIAAWGQRESWEQQADSFNMNSRGAIAMTKMLQKERENTLWQITVPAYAQGRRIFVDYGIGDWIGVSQFQGATPNYVDAFRVMAITIQVTSDNDTQVELSLQSTRQAFLARLQARLTALMNHKDAPQIYVQNEPPIYAKPGDMWTPISEVDNT